MNESPELDQQDQETPEPEDNSIWQQIFYALFVTGLIGLFVVLPLLMLAYVGYWLKVGNWPTWTLLGIAPSLLPQDPWEWEGVYKLWRWFLTAPLATVPVMVSLLCLFAALALGKLNEE